MLIKPLTTESPEGEKCLQSLLSRFELAENSCCDLVTDIIAQVKDREMMLSLNTVKNLIPLILQWRICRSRLLN